ncbi:MAG: homoserine O-acetyltransferase [Kiritimatiellae bacterium]|nr:homoserine O-acetyltransferase [Kiritimatiellia bacterium]
MVIRGKDVILAVHFHKQRSGVKDTQNANSVGVVQAQTLKLNLPEGGYRLEKGGILPEIVVTYERCGKITPENDNVIFICHALTGDAHVAGIRPGETEPSGWWENMIGPGRGVDTNVYQVICANILGGCQGTTGPSSIDPRTGKPYGSAFPKMTVRDIVDVHRMLLRQLGINRVVAVMGGSFGGMQTLDWVIRHSEEVDKALIIASAARLSSQSLAFDIVGRNAIVEDPKWNGGDYYGQSEQPDSGLASARKLAHITYLSQQLMEDKFGREKRPEWVQEAQKTPGFQKKMEHGFHTYFQIESYLQYQGAKFIQRFDANSYLHITLAMDEYDAAEAYGGLENAFHNVTSRILVASLSGDWLFAPEQSEELVYALLREKKRVSYCRLYAPAGHDAFLTHITELKQVVNAFLPPIPPAKQREIEADKDAPHGYRQWQVRHYQQVLDFIKPGSRVVDLGCGNGSLLNILRQRLGCVGYGVDFNIDHVIAALVTGCDVVMGDLDEGLDIIPDNSVDTVVLSETLQTIRKPRSLLERTLQIARETVVSFPNFACWNVRSYLFFIGRMPMSKQLPLQWYDTPNIHLFTWKDFSALCQKERLKILQLHAVARGWIERILCFFGMKNLGASRMIVRLTKEKGKE